MQSYNDIQIRDPRWKDKAVLVAEWKIGNQNKITIASKKTDGTPRYPEPFYMSGEALKSYPIEVQPHGRMHVVPLSDVLGTKGVVPNA